MRKNEEKRINNLWGDCNSSLTDDQLKKIEFDLHEKRYANGEMNMMNIRVKTQSQSRLMGKYEMSEEMKKREIERRLTIERRKERLLKEIK